MIPEIEKEVKRRKTFAIISHPDAGKTTLTEKLLLYGGAIRLAGSVKGRKAQKHASSDWMEIEKQRGISVTSSVMNFDYQGYRINILDTPGHQDFSEDTYRTLMAADSAVMLIDGAKGVEAQTKKLFHVCRMRGIPIFTFVNKLDRYCKSPLSLMEEIEETLGIRSCPMNWPVGLDGNYKGIFKRKTSQIELFENDSHGQRATESTAIDLDDAAVPQILGKDVYDALLEEIELLDIAGDNFDMERVLKGELTPIFFGSAMTNFGVQPFLEEFINIAPSPKAKVNSDGEIEPENEDFSGFVFKIQANMDPSHRDRIAFLRVCSGKYEKGLDVKHVRMNRSIKLSQSQQFMAQDREFIEEAYAGDIIGIFDPGIFKIGDTLCGGKLKFSFDDIPMFPPEYFAVVMAKDASKRKQFLKGINQLSEEGAIQIFKEPDIGMEMLTIGAAGILQFEVLEHRMKNEYNAEIILQKQPYIAARWVSGAPIARDMLSYSMSATLFEDQYQRQVLLFKDQWAIRRMQEKYPDVTLLEIAPPVTSEI